MPRLKVTYFMPPDSDNLTNFRTKMRKLRCITYDCRHSRVRGEDVFCGRGHKFPSSNSGVMKLLSVLRGRSSSICQGCPSFETDDPE